MDLIDRLKSIGERVEKLKDQVNTEEATKNAFVMPFISALGYDVFNPTEVIPEFIADVGVKKGEKVDYCIQWDNAPAIIVECKHWKDVLTNHNSQLHRYFHVTSARFAILTNGILYRFYTDLDAPNLMDEKPFLEFSIDKLSDSTINELKKFTKGNFDIEEIVNNASDLKYSKEIKAILSSEFQDPSEDFVRYFASKVYSGRLTSKVIDQFKGLVLNSTKSLLSEMISGRLEKALESEKSSIEEPPVQEPEPAIEEKSDIETTEEEIQGFRIVQAILMKHINIDRVAYRDAKTYFNILLDDNNRKPICRLWFNRSQKYLGVFDENKNEERIAIYKLEDIFSHSEKILSAVFNYVDGSAEAAST